ncbi:hypothetical protein C8F04DRAFT_1395516 [Mycena alexandri]|uniref:Uncharacterized protein n=1 Tax=Mycena alexandri TaxID=1745969 RepID=A0AAD6SUV5_9AGAR|nr:hypothetical protein C8F04DRAFT_1395516 [Mycena alexandri]
MSSLIAQLFCCCVRPRAAATDVESTVIPNEHSRLLDPPSPAIVVDHQKLSDRLGTIVRAKVGKMVSVSARTPFTLHDAEQLPSASTANRRPPILTMTPARSQGSLNLHSDSRSRHSSRSGSRASSRQPELRSHSAHSTNSAPPSATSAPLSVFVSEDPSKSPVDASEWFAESESELSVEDEVGASDHTPNVPAAPPAGDPQGIAFDWDDLTSL